MEGSECKSEADEDTDGNKNGGVEGGKGEKNLREEE